MWPGFGEETDYLLHPTAKDQKGSLRILGSGKILSHLDTWIVKPGQTTLQGNSRLQKGPSKLETRPRKGFPGDKETVSECPCARAARCNMTIQSLHLWKKITQLWGSSPKCWVYGSGHWLPVKVLRHSGLRVASMSPSPGYYNDPNQGG
jgi:hypothetical protein